MRIHESPPVVEVLGAEPLWLERPRVRGTDDAVTAPAPLSIVLEKLHSPTPDVRTVALIHARAHGRAARSLAVEISRMFEDRALPCSGTRWVPLCR